MTFGGTDLHIAQLTPLALSVCVFYLTGNGSPG